MRKQHLYLLFAFLGIILTSCSKESQIEGLIATKPTVIDTDDEKDNGNGPPTNTPKLYYFTSDGVYLNNTKISDIKADGNATLDENNNIYYNDNVSVFKNGIAISSPASPEYFISCYYTDGNDIYVGGCEYMYINVQLYSRVAYWKNGQKMPLEIDNWSDENGIYKISSISKYNGEIYLSGISRIANIPYSPVYNMLWKNGKFIHPDTYYPFYSNQNPITVNGQLVCVSKDGNSNYRLYDINTSLGSDWYDVTTAFSFLKCEYGDNSYTVSTRIYKDVGYLRCKTGEVALSFKDLYAISCTYNGINEYVCLGDRTLQQHNIVYKNGVKMNLPAMFANLDIYKIIEK